MKTDKKAILGFAIAMIFSLAIMQGTYVKSGKQDFCLQQLCGASAVVASKTEGAVSAAFAATSVMAGAVAVNLTTQGITNIYATAPVTPFGIGYWVTTACIAL